MHFNIGGKRISLPNSWHEVSLGQLLTIRSKAMADLDALAVLSNESVAFWQAVNSLDIAAVVMPSLQWSIEPFDWNALVMPIWYYIPGKGSLSICRYVYGVPGNLDLETYGQKVFIESLLGNKMSDAERVPMVLAAYFEPIYSGLPFNTERLEDFLPVILSTRCTEALPIYSFFYMRFSASMHIMAG